MAKNIDSIRKIEDTTEKKLLDFNLEKSCLIIIGSKRFEKKINEDLKINPIKFCNEVMRISDSEKYLGDYISSSLSESVFKTIQKRKGLAMRLICEIKVTLKE